MVGWHHRLNGHEFEQTLGDSGGHGNLACCSPWVTKSWTQLKMTTILAAEAHAIKPETCSPGDAHSGGQRPRRKPVVPDI